MKLNRRIVLARRPVGEVQAEDLRYVEEPLPLPNDDQILVRNLYISLDPATRGWMDDKASYMKPIPIDGVMLSAGLAVVESSPFEDWKAGDLVAGLFGWEEYSILTRQQMARRAGTHEGLPLSYELGVLGGNGLTAYIGLHKIGLPKPGETVLVSAASGAVGSIVGQLAKIHGCRVVGITGGAAKADMLVETLGFDAAVDYKNGRLYEDLRAACPEGVDVYFDNVGGEILDVALTRINVHARVVLCGAIAQINETALPPGPKNYIRLLARRARMEGFITLDYAREWNEISEILAKHVLRGEIKVLEEVVEGLEAIPQAFARLFRGEKIGKLVVKVS